MKKIIDTSEYALNQQNNVWSRPGYSGISYNDGDEIEQRIASIVDKASDTSVLSVELREQCIDWPSLYHLSGSRANILRPFLDILKGDILEIGAGCGAITRYLGECNANVLALEGSPRRASIARARTAELENVTVLAEKFSEFKCEYKFDVITLIGVLEYANMFTPAENPALSMLQQVRSLLKPHGKLIIAIENQLGLKYFAGAPEDHIGQAMYGIEGRYRNDQPQTFGKKALTELLNKSEFINAEFLAPFPDYKLPVSVLTEKGMQTPVFDASVFAWQSVRRDPQLPPLSNFSMELAWPEIFKNDVAMELSNSFLVIASQEQEALFDNDRELLAYHYSTDRVPEYCKETRFQQIVKTGEIEIIYKRLGEGQQSKCENTQQLIDFDCPDKDTYTSGRPLSSEFIEIVSRDGWSIEQVGDFIKHYILVLEYFLQQSDINIRLDSPDVRLPKEFFDISPQNIIISEHNEPVIIDAEWILREEISLGHLLFRSLLLMIGSITRFGHNLEGRELSRIDFIHLVFHEIGFKLTEKHFETYVELEAKVQKQVTGRDIDEFLEWWPKQVLPSQNSSQALCIAEQKLQNLQQILIEKDQFISTLLNSLSWRLTKPFRVTKRSLSRLKRLLSLPLAAVNMGGGLRPTSRKAFNLWRTSGINGLLRGFHYVIARGLSSEVLSRNDYQEWIKHFDKLTDNKRQELLSSVENFASKPLISIVMPTYNAKPEWLIEAIESVRNQIYPYWELCIADDASTDTKVREILKQYNEIDERIKVVFRHLNGHISVASNSALELAKGEWIALMDHDDLLSEHALYWVADAINSNHDIRIVYSDEDKIDEKGTRQNPYFKCEFNRSLFYSHNMISHLGVYQSDLIKKVGGFRAGYEGAQDHDLALRCIEQIDESQIHHIPRVLYHWRVHFDSTAGGADAKPYAMRAGERALTEHFQRLSIAANVNYQHPGYRVRYELPEQLPLVSLIIPTRNGLALIKTCVESIRHKTTYQNYEIIIVDNASDDSECLAYFKKLTHDSSSRIRVLRDERPFNYSALNNRAVQQANGEIIGLINNDIEVIEPDWLSEMVSHVIQPDVGAVGAKLLYPDNTVQHSGVVMGVGGVAGHAFKHFHMSDIGYFSRACVVNDFSAVTAACLLVMRKNFEMVNGLNEQELTVAFNDVDFCLRLKERGLRNVFTPFARLYHHESATRGMEDNPEKKARFNKEVSYMRNRWGKYLINDPCYSPNLTIEHEDFSLAWPPRL